MPVLLYYTHDFWRYLFVAIFFSFYFISFRFGRRWRPLQAPWVLSQPKDDNFGENANTHMHSTHDIDMTVSNWERERESARELAAIDFLIKHFHTERMNSEKSEYEKNVQIAFFGRPNSNCSPKTFSVFSLEIKLLFLLIRQRWRGRMWMYARERQLQGMESCERRRNRTRSFFFFLLTWTTTQWLVGGLRLTAVNINKVPEKTECGRQKLMWSKNRLLPNADFALINLLATERGDIRFSRRRIKCIRLQTSFLVERNRDGRGKLAMDCCPFFRNKSCQEPNRSDENLNKM